MRDFPAFPRAATERIVVDMPQDGMTLRDWFAGQALIGLLASAQWFDLTADRYGLAAYEQADAMLEAREAK